MNHVYKGNEDMPELRIAFLDVGHGDFVYATTPLGDNLIIDIGSGDVIPSNFLNNVLTISEVQVSHPHTDHFDDIVAISKKKIKSFRCPQLDKFSDQSIGWRKSDKTKIAKLREMKRTLKPNNGAVAIGNGFSHTVWFPDTIDTNDPNTTSMVTTLSYAGVKILLGGDLPESGWKNLLQNREFVSAISDTTIFKVPHHGRKEGCCKDLFEHIFPKLCIISDKSMGKDNENTVATPWYSQRAKGCNVVGSREKRKVLSTRSDKSIFIKINEKGAFWVYTNTTWRKD
jgi:beta-lactamase superfamily II metal-dependent hydrolase